MTSGMQIADTRAARRDWTLACSLICFLILALSLFPAAVLAQSRSADEMLAAKGAEKERQRQVVEKLRAFAKKQAGGREDTAEYWAAIRTNLARLKNTGGERSIDALSAGFIRPDAKDVASADEKAIAVLRDRLRRIENGERIYGGEIVQPGEFPAVVSIALRKGQVFSSFCTGTMIAKGVILTAAHCVCEAPFDADDGQRPVVVFGTNVNRTEGIVAAYEISEAQTRSSDRVSWCQSFVSFGVSAARGRDIATVRFYPDEPLREVGGRALPPAPPLPEPMGIALPQMFFGMDIDEAFLVGFGYSEAETENIGVKRFTSTGIVDKICSTGGARKYECVTGIETVVLDYEAKRDSCGGDSGGPVFIKSGQSDYYLFAVTSRGIGRNCGPGGIYSLVTPGVLDWLALGDQEVNVRTCYRARHCVPYLGVN